MDGEKQVAFVILSIKESLKLERSVLLLKLKDLFIDFPGILLVAVIFLFVEFDEVKGLVNV